MVEVMVFDAPQYPLNFKLGPLAESLSEGGWIEPELALPCRWSLQSLSEALRLPHPELGGEVFHWPCPPWPVDRRTAE
ncbi:MAG: hypothetical protein K2Y39_11300 [Candidatus Obscuribacterales bacterium]|nr:hypothetical protein [Candidatus Obscuribacterales bacterium]